MPSQRCDCHIHVFGPAELFPGTANRVYTPTPQTIAQYHEAFEAVGLHRAVLVQPSAYGADNRCMLGTLQSDPVRYRGVAVINAETSDDELAAMDKAGVRGVRLNIHTDGTGTGTAGGALQAVAARVARYGWHVQIYAAAALIMELAPAIRAAGVPVVLDHMGGASTAAGLDEPGFRTVLELLSEGKVWVKLSGADRVTKADDGFERAVPFAKALVAANSANLVWGSDWPHLGNHGGTRGQNAPPAIYRPLDARALFEVLTIAVPDEKAREAILVTNAARLYRF